MFLKTPTLINLSSSTSSLAQIKIYQFDINCSISWQLETKLTTVISLHHGPWVNIFFLAWVIFPWFCGISWSSWKIICSKILAGRTDTWCNVPMLLLDNKILLHSNIRINGSSTQNAEVNQISRQFFCIEN